MSGIAAYKAQLKLGGIATNFGDEPLVELSTLIFRVTNPIKRVLSANHTVIIEDDNNVEVLIPKNINYLEGVIHFSTDPSLDYAMPLKMQATYIPLEYIGGAKDYSLEIGGDVLDTSAFHSDTDLSAGYRERINGIHDISCSFSKLFDVGNNNNKIKAAKLAKTPIFVSVNPGASSTFIKGWFQIETDSFSGDIGALEDEALSLVLCGNNTKTYFSYSYNYSDVEAQALTEQELIDNWFF